MNKVEGYRRSCDAFAGASAVVLIWMMVASAYDAFPNVEPSVVAAIALAVEFIFVFTELKKRRSNRVVIGTQMLFATWVVLLVADHQKDMMFPDVLPMIETAVFGAALVPLALTLLYVLNGFRQKTSPGF